jgi:hypothetical protein
MATVAAAYAFDPLRELAASALSRIAAMLRPEDYGSLPNRTVPGLCYALAKAEFPLGGGKPDPQTVMVVLQALGVIGDGRAIKAVERIAKVSHIIEAREAATRLLPILHQRAAESQASGQLLRPSSAAADAQEVLLRAAAGSAETDSSEVLVRATAGPEEER